LNKALNKAIPRSGLSFLEAGILTLAYLMFFTQGEQEIGKKSGKWYGNQEPNVLLRSFFLHEAMT
jgi:hypothetical protein